jgi:hypothetical protein
MVGMANDAPPIRPRKRNLAPQSFMVQKPLSKPEREAKALNPEAKAIIESDAGRGAAQ